MRYDMFEKFAQQFEICPHLLHSNEQSNYQIHRLHLFTTIMTKQPLSRQKLDFVNKPNKKLDNYEN